MVYNKLTGKEGTWSRSVPFNGLSLVDSLKMNSPLNEEVVRPASPAPSSRGERRVKTFLEKMFQRPFRKQRPTFLNNPVTGGTYNLELDCYNEELQLAVEFNGRQHYEYVPFFHKNKEAFLNQKYRDEMKRRKCYERGILLIEVPYTEEKKLETYLLQRLRNYQRVRDSFVDVSVDVE